MKMAESLSGKFLLWKVVKKVSKKSIFEVMFRNLLNSVVL